MRAEIESSHRADCLVIRLQAELVMRDLATHCAVRRALDEP